MKKHIPILIIGILVLSGLGAVAISKTTTIKQVKHVTISLSDPTFTDIGKYLFVKIREATSFMMETGKPMTPIFSWTTTFDAGTEITDIKIDYDMKEYKLTKKIQPAPSKIPSLDGSTSEKLPTEFVKDNSVYLSAEQYPGETYDIQRGAGVISGIHFEFVNIKIYTQYLPENDILYVPTNIDITIEYKPPSQPLFTGEEYDLLIITPEKFIDNLQPLVNHKENMGLRTYVKSVEQIYEEYDGRDDPEDIKLFIYDALDENGLNWGIDYVFLVGGRKGQSNQWYIPERRTNLDDGYETGFASDLYFADIYKEGYEFEDWDSNGNGIFAEWTPLNRDYIDHYPDVTVARLPCRYSFEVNIVVDKIITYETTTANKSWFNSAVVIAGDTLPYYTPGYYEGEIETAITADMFENIGFDVTKLWTSTETLTGPSDVINEINNGAGFFHFAAGGTPGGVGTFLPNDINSSITCLSLRHIPLLTNGDKLPVVLFGGGCAAQFNVTILNLFYGILEYGLRDYFIYIFPWKAWVPIDISSWLLMKNRGGSIGSIGNSGRAWLYCDQYCVEGLTPWMSIRFFHTYANQSINILGNMHDQAIVDYLNIIGGVNSDDANRKTVEEFTLLGDPSLKIGGYD